MKVNRFTPTCNPEGFLKISNMLTQSPKVMTPVVGTAIRFNSCTHEVIVEFNDGIYGIIPENEISIYDFTYPNHSDDNPFVPHQILSLIGRKVRAIVLGQLEDGTFLLSRKRSMLEAWNSINVGDILYAQITNIINSGIFIDIGFGILSYVPIKDCSVSRITDIKKWFKQNEYVTIKVLNKQSLYRIDSSIKQAYFNLDELVELNLIDTYDVISVKISQPILGGYYCEYTPNVAGIVNSSNDIPLAEGTIIPAIIKKITPKGLKLKQLL